MPLQPLPRRSFLRASGVAVALPLLDAMQPRVLRAESAAEADSGKRMVLIGRALGLHAPYFFPQGVGRNYVSSRYLKILEPYRNDFTVFSGMSHHYGGGHGTLAGLMTGVAPERMRPGDVRNSISLDQEVAEQLDVPTRYASLVFGRSGLAWNRSGVRVPAEGRATQVFKKLFLDGTREEVEQELLRLEAGASILDGVRAQVRGLARQLGASDRDRIDLLLTSVREAERRLDRERAWAKTPKPKVDVEPFTDDFLGVEILDRERQWLELIHLSLQTDTTRVISIYLPSHGNVTVDGQTFGHHEASHHGRDESTIERLATIEQAQLRVLAEFLGKLKETRVGNATLLDKTQVFYASDLGNASAHTTSNLPVLLAGGGYRHAGHVAFDTKKNKPLSNLYVRMLQHMDIEMDRFGSSTSVVGEV